LTSTGRCTKGVYFTLQKFPSNVPNKKGVKWLLMLDTEGLGSPEKSDHEFDRKIVLFAMLAADILIINTKGDMNSQMTNLLQMSCINFDLLRKFGKPPEVLYSFTQNKDNNKGPFRD